MQVAVTLSILLFCFYMLIFDPIARADPKQYQVAISSVGGYWFIKKSEDNEDDEDD